MYYRHDKSYILIEKSEIELTGDGVVTCDEDINIQIFEVIVGAISDDGVMLRHTKILRDAEIVAVELKNLQDENAELRANKAASEAEIDYRLCLLELGLV